MHPFKKYGEKIQTATHDYLKLKEINLDPTQEDINILQQVANNVEHGAKIALKTIFDTPEFKEACEDLNKNLTFESECFQQARKKNMDIGHQHADMEKFNQDKEKLSENGKALKDIWFDIKINYINEHLNSREINTEETFKNTMDELSSAGIVVIKTLLGIVTTKPAETLKPDKTEKPSEDIKNMPLPSDPEISTANN